MRPFQYISREHDRNTNVMIQPSLEIGKEDDEHEKEANHVADKVMKMPDPSASIQKMHDKEEEKEKMVEGGKKVQMMVDSPLKISKMTNYPDSGLTASPNVEQGINSSKGKGQSLDIGLQSELGNKMGADFSEVKLHTGENAVQMNKEIGAKAFTHGSDIYFNSGQYNPATNTGKHLLAHELTHTVQQGKSLKRKIQRQGGKIINHQDMTTTITAHIYYVPKTKDNIGKPGRDNWFTEAEVQAMRGGLEKELTKKVFVDFNNIDPIEGPYKVKFDVKFIPTGSSSEARLNVMYGPEGYKVNPDKSITEVPEKIPEVNTGMTLSKSKEEIKVLPDGSIGKVKGGSTTGKLSITNAYDGHDVAHELFHNLIHNHPNAPLDLKNLINPADQEEGHYKAGGIFVYENPNKGRKKQDLNQQNIDDALRTLPLISQIERTVFERKK